MGNSTSKTALQVQVESGQVEPQLAKIAGHFEEWGEKIASIGKKATLLSGVGLVATKIFKGFESFTDKAEAVGKWSKQLGIAAEQLSLVGEGFKNLEAVGQGTVSLFEKINQAVHGGADQQGSARAKRLFDQLGLNAADLEGMALPEQFRTIAEAMAGLEHESQRVALATQLFGSAGLELVPKLRKGGAAVDEMMAKAKSLGLVLSNEDVEAVEQNKLAWKELDRVFEGIGRTLGTVLVPALKAITAVLEPLAKGVDIVSKGWESLFDSISTKDNPGIIMANLNKVEGKFKALGVEFGKSGGPGTKPKEDDSEYWKWFDGLLSDLVKEERRITEEMRNYGRAVEDVKLDRFTALLGSRYTDQLAALIRKQREFNEVHAQEGVGRQLREELDGMAGYAEAINKVAAARQAGAISADEFARSIQRIKDAQGQQLVGDTLTPIETFRKQLQQLDKARQSGLIGWGQYGIALGKIFEQMKGLAGLTEQMRTAPQLVAGSREAAETIIRAKLGDQQQNPAQQMLQVLKLIQKQGDIENKIGQELLKALGKGPAVKIQTQVF